MRGVMAGKMSYSSPSALSIGNCLVEVEGNNVNCESSNANASIQISVADTAKIKISVSTSGRYYTRKSSKGVLHSGPGETVDVDGDSVASDIFFVLVNPKDIDSRSKSLLQEVLQIYIKELPAMNYAANTGKKSQFLERCVLNGKYCTLLLKSNTVEGSGEVVAAVTYQIIPADTQYVEIPLAAVNSSHQHKGIGRMMYLELRKRLQHVGIRTIFCWADKDSEGFWLKQGFVPVGEVDSKGKARKLPIKADIRRALCIPGGSTLMVSHMDKDNKNPANPSKNSKLCFLLKPHAKPPSSVPVYSQELRSAKEWLDVSRSNFRQEGDVMPEIIPQIGNCQSQVLVKDSHFTDYQKPHALLAASTPGPDSIQGCKEISNAIDSDEMDNELGVMENRDDADIKQCFCSRQGSKRRVWEASLSSLKSKKVKGGHRIDCPLDSDCDISFMHDEEHCSGFDPCSLGTLKDHSNMGVSSKDPLPNQCLEETRPVHIEERYIGEEESHRIMLMNIADDVKKTFLSKIIRDLGGAITSDGSVSTHIITGKARRTLNFCSALCSGAWIISASWLKTSYREGRFVDELPFILEDEDYELKYESRLRDAVLRAKSCPRALLKGYDICLAKHVQPSSNILSAIVQSAGGNILRGLDKVLESSRTIFIACEEDMEEALLAAKSGIRTYSSDWFMYCIMKQELDLQAPQFAESL